MVRPLKESNQPRKTIAYSLKIINHEMIESLAKPSGNKSGALDKILDNVRKMQSMNTN